jgi:sulfonate transport system substrate-binding protein
MPYFIANASAAEPVAIRFPWATVPTELWPLYYAKPELLKNYRRSYDIEFVRVRGSGQQIPALVANELQFGGLSAATMALAIQNAKLTDLRIVACGGQDGIDDYFSGEFSVLADSPIKTIADLKSHIIATTGIGGSTDMALRKLLTDNGLDLKRDISFVELDFANMLPALTEKRIDMASMALPWAYFAKKNKQVRVIGRIKDSMGPNQKNVLVARAPFIEKNRAALVDLFEDMLIANHWMLDARNRKEAIQLVANFNKAPIEEFSEWVFTKEDNYRDPDIRPNLAYLKRNMETMLALGIFKEGFDVYAYSDLSLLDDAKKRLT